MRLSRKVDARKLPPVMRRARLKRMLQCCQGLHRAVSQGVSELAPASDSGIGHRAIRAALSPGAPTYEEMYTQYLST